MSVETAIVNRLENYAGLTALISTRIYTLLMPQKATLPNIVYQVVSALRESAMGSDTGEAQKVFQVASWGSSASSARAVATQVRGALQRLSGTYDSVVINAVFIETEFDGYDDDTGYFSVIQRFRAHYKES